MRDKEMERRRPSMKGPMGRLATEKPRKGIMGGGMIMRPMGYKAGKSVKAKCKLGRNKPTKMY